MSAVTGLVPVSHLGRGSLPVARGPWSVARMRSLYRVDKVVKRLDKLPQRGHESLRATNEPMRW